LSVGIFFLFCRSIYPVGKNFFLVETVDNSKHYKPSNKIVIDVQAGVNIFNDRVGIVKHVTDLVDELCAKWNDQYHAQPQVNFKIANLSYRSLPKSLTCRLGLCAAAPN
jgi:hypothetical protein